MKQISPLLFDVKLCYIFVEIYRQKSVSQAADLLGLTQPAVSIGLKRLREHFNNPLFTRIGNEMQVSELDRKTTRLNSSHVSISYAVFCLKKKKKQKKDHIKHYT